MAQEYADTQNAFPDGWDVAQHGYVGPAPEYQSGGYYDPGALAAYSVAPPEPELECYVPDSGTSVEVAFDNYVNDDADAAHPSSAFGFLHYLPPAAISKKYYALQDPNVYPADEPGASSFPPPPLPVFDSESPSATTDPYPDAALIVTSSPAPKVEPGEDQRPMASLTPPPPSPLDSTPTPTASPAYHQDFRFQPHGGWHPTPSGPPDCAHPVLPKQRRNRDDPGGDTGRLAQVCADSGPGYGPELEDQTGVGFPYVAPGAGGMYEYDQAMTAQQQPVIVPSQWKVGAVLDRLRFPQYSGDWDTLMAAVHGEGYHACMPRSSSPLSAEELAQLEQLRVDFGLGLSAPMQPTTPMTPMTPTTPAMDEEDMTIAVYSPLTGRRIPVTAGPDGPVLHLSAVPPSARRPHKRGGVAACAFCRRRKIACGGPQEGDEARRCGQCIQRQQPCEFPGTSYQHAHPVPLSAPPYSYAHPAHRVGDAPR